MGEAPRMGIYVDGFNVYYRALYSQPECKWLDVSKLASALFPSDEIRFIKYFTADIRADRIDKNKHVRQQAYLRALSTLPNVQVIKGNYLVKPTRMPLFADWQKGTETLVQVVKMEEKGSDVNLASHLLADAFADECDVAAVFTTDSDYREPFRIMKSVLKRKVILVCPDIPQYGRDGNSIHREPPKTLLTHVSGVKKYRLSLLADCQLPDRITDKHGAVHKPTSWAKKGEPA